MRVAVCGGGNLAHAFVGELGRHPLVKSLLVISRRPNEWQEELEVFYNHKFNHISKITQITSSFEVLRDVDVVILSLPAQVKIQYIKIISKYISPKTILISALSIGGINFAFEKYLSNNQYACLQRVPYICRTIKYGQSVNTEIKKEVEIYFSKNSSIQTKDLIKSILNIPFKELNSYWTLMLSNSNPILHIAGMCEILRQNYPFDYLPGLYAIWTDFASELALDMDSELAFIMSKLNVIEYRNLYEHYQVRNTRELTSKLKNIESFKDVLSPLKENQGKFYIDENSRYVVEDLPYGTCFIKYIAELLGIHTPHIDFAIRKIQPFMNMEFVTNEGKFNYENWKNVTNFDFDKVIRNELGI